MEELREEDIIELTEEQEKEFTDGKGEEQNFFSKYVII